MHARRGEIVGSSYFWAELRSNINFCLKEKPLLQSFYCLLLLHGLSQRVANFAVKGNTGDALHFVGGTVSVAVHSATDHR